VSTQKRVSINVYAAPSRFFHLVFAAFWAILLRCFAVKLSALALPPLDAPSLDNATAAGFFTRSGGCSNGVPFHFSPIRSSMTERANRFGSLGRFGLSLLAREGMVRLSHEYVEDDDPQDVQKQTGKTKHSGPKTLRVVALYDF
jgi:hypothetical protein